MAMSFSLGATNNTASGSSLTLSPGAIAANQRVIIVVALRNTSSAPSVSGISKTGATVTQVSSRATQYSQINSDFANMSIWTCESGAGISSGTWTISFTAGTIAYAEMWVIGSYAVGVNPSVGNNVVNAASAQAISYASATVTNGDMLLSAASTLPVQTGIANIAKDTTPTAISDLSDGNQQFVSQRVSPSAGSTTTTFSGSVRQSISMAVRVPAPGGTVTQALTGFNQALVATETVPGSATQTLTGFNQLVSAQEKFIGTTAQTLLGFSQALVAQEIFEINFAEQSLNGFSQELSGLQIFIGDIAQTLTGFNQLLEGDVPQLNVIEQDLQGFNQLASGQLVYSGALVQTLFGFNQSADGLEIIGGDVVQTLAGFNQVLNGVQLGDPFTGGNWYSWRYQA